MSIIAYTLGTDLNFQFNIQPKLYHYHPFPEKNLGMTLEKKPESFPGRITSNQILPGK